MWGLISLIEKLNLEMHASVSSTILIESWQITTQVYGVQSEADFGVKISVYHNT